MKICLIAEDNPHYVHSVVQSLASTGIRIDLIADDRYENLDFSSNVGLMNFRGSRSPGDSVAAKLLRVLRYYTRCLAYMWKSDTEVVHIQGFRFCFLEGVVLLSLYRMFGKTVVYTAHNLQPKGRHDAFTYLLFFFIYRITNHIICHTTKMRATLLARYKIPGAKVSVVRHGLNFSVPIAGVEQTEARRSLGIDPGARVLLIFGKIQRYKGIDVALQALKHLHHSTDQLVLLVVGGGDNNDERYLNTLTDYVRKENLASLVKFHTRFVRDKEIEMFFQAADLLLLPYREGEFQSGVLFLAYRFGLPVIVSDLGSLQEDVEEGVTGLLFRSEDPVDLANKITHYYQGLFLRPALRKHIQQYALDKYSRDRLSRKTVEVYQQAQQVC